MTRQYFRRMVVALLALLDFVVGDARSDSSRARVLQADPVDCVGVLDLLSVDVAVVPQIEATAPVRHQLVAVDF